MMKKTQTLSPTNALGTVMKSEKRTKRKVCFADEVQTIDGPKKGCKSDDDWSIKFSLTDLRQDTTEDSDEGTFTFSVAMNTNDDRNAETGRKSGTGSSHKRERMSRASNNAFNTRLLRFTDEISWTKRQVVKGEPTKGVTNEAVTPSDNILDGKCSNVANASLHPRGLHEYISGDAGQKVSKQSQEQTIQYYLDKVMQKPFKIPITEIRKQRLKTHI